MSASTEVPVEPCPGCGEGWREVGYPYCASCKARHSVSVDALFEIISDKVLSRLEGAKVPNNVHELKAALVACIADGCTDAAKAVSSYLRAT